MNYATSDSYLPRWTSRCLTNHRPSVNENFTSHWTCAISVAPPQQQQQIVAPLTETKSMLRAANSSYLAGPISAIYPCTLPSLPPSPSFAPSLFFCARSTLPRPLHGCQTLGNNLRSPAIYSYFLWRDGRMLRSWCISSTHRLFPPPPQYCAVRTVGGFTWG